MGSILSWPPKDATPFFGNTAEARSAALTLLLPANGVSGRMPTWTTTKFIQCRRGRGASANALLCPQFALPPNFVFSAFVNSLRALQFVIPYSPQTSEKFSRKSIFSEESKLWRNLKGLLTDGYGKSADQRLILPHFSSSSSTSFFCFKENLNNSTPCPFRFFPQLSRELCSKAGSKPKRTTKGNKHQQPTNPGSCQPPKKQTNCRNEGEGRENFF